MLQSLNEVIGYAMSAYDGDIGECSDFLFEDRPWTVRYMVADTRHWLPGRKVLIPMIALSQPDDMARRLQVDLTIQQVKDSPPLSEDEPVSRQYEKVTFLFYGWPAYWAESSDGPESTESFLRSVKEVTGYFIQTPDKGVGYLRSLIFDNTIWAIRYLDCIFKKDSKEKALLIASDWVDSVDWLNKTIHIEMPFELIQRCPSYDSSKRITRSQEVELYDHFGREYYW
jgi:hypothetical protein